MVETIQDQPKQSPAEVPGVASTDQHEPAFDSMALLNQYGQVKVAQASPGGAPTGTDAIQPAPAGDGTAQSCPANPDYDRYIDVASRFIFDPKDLGDIAGLEHKFDCDIHDTPDVFKYANQALAVTGDRFDHVMPPAEVKAFEQQQRSGYSGIGLEIAPGAKDSAGATVIKTALPGKPAQKAGLEAGDSFVKIDGKDVHTLVPGDIVDLLTSGQPGSKVDIVVDRNGEPVEKIVTRQAIESPPVVHDKDLGDGIAYIKIDHFNSNSEAAQLAAAMDKHKDAKAFVIDVRENPGGLIDQALQSAELFVKDGTLMTSRQRHDSPPDKPVYDEVTEVLGKNSLIETATTSDTGAKSVNQYHRLPYKADDRPVVVLTDANSASASEIFTGAVHDTAHDTTEGDTSFGKGIGQTVLKNMPDGGYLKVTSLHYLTPAGNWPGPGTGHDINHPEYGLKPDRPVDNPPETQMGSPSDAQLNDAVSFLKGRLQAASTSGATALPLENKEKP